MAGWAVGEEACGAGWAMWADVAVAQMYREWSLRAGRAAWGAQHDSKECWLARSGAPAAFR